MTSLIHQTTKLVIFCFLGIGAATPALAAPPTPISACPYTITTPGNYAVTQNLSMSSIGNCISLVPPLANVTIDLQQHTITGSGPNNVGGTGISCFLDSNGDKCDSVIIVNGTISKFASAGISIAGDGNIVSGVTASANGLGVAVGGRTAARTNMITGVTANGNTGDGIQLGAFSNAFSNAFSAVNDSTADGNGGNGITASAGSINNCEASNNAQVGLSGLFVNGSKAHNNTGDGILIASGYTGVFNSTATGNGGNGIVVSGGGGTGRAGGNIVDSIAQNNAGIGIQLGCPATAYNNVANNNTGGDIVPENATCELFGNKPAP